MLKSAKKNHILNNHSDPHSGETLFEFLKRKKKVNLQQSISQHKSVNKSSIQQKQVYTPLNQTKRQKETMYCTSKHNESLNLTPKRVTFAEGEQKKAVNRSFIEMISPFKRRNNSGLDRNNTPESIPKSKNVKENYTRKNLNEKIKILKDTLQGFIQTGKSVKQKSHLIFLDLKPMLKLIEQDSNFQKKVQELRLKLRTFQNQLRSFNIENSNQIIEQFHRGLSQHLNSVEAELRTEYQKNHMSTMIKIKQDKQITIQNLGEKNANMQKQIEFLQRKLQKSDKIANKLKQQQAQKEQQYQKIIENKINEYQMKSINLQKQIKRINQELIKSKQRQKQLQKQSKNIQYLKQEQEKKYRTEVEEIRSTKQQYLLNEIIILKKQFQSDMAQLTTLYTNKQTDYLKTIKELQQQLNHQLQKKCRENQYQKIIEETQNNHKFQISKYKKQNECLVTDMHRMNQQLYQHWLALKDIKILSNRLQIYNKFKKIYDDLAYNDHLFG